MSWASRFYASRRIFDVISGCLLAAQRATATFAGGALGKVEAGSIGFIRGSKKRCRDPVRRAPWRRPWTASRLATVLKIFARPCSGRDGPGETDREAHVRGPSSTPGAGRGSS